MNMQMCARCHKRVAVVFISRMDNQQSVHEGLCLQCAKELDIKPISEMLEKLGINEEDFERMSEDMRNIFGENLPDVANGFEEDGGAPAIDLPKIFSNFGGFSNSPMDKNTNSSKQSSKKDSASNEKKKYLSAYCRNLTALASEGKIDKIVGRKRELDRMIQILCRRQKNNPCLIGEPGVGKTAIAEALAWKIVSGDVPYLLQNKEVYLLDLTALVAGTQFRGQFESRILGLISEVKHAGNVILVIDEVHNLVGAGESEGSMNAGNILKPALSRGEIQVIGATTLKEYRKFIEKDSALERRFQPIIVEEPSIEESVQMLRGIKEYYQAFHHIQIPDLVLRDAVLLSERYITDRFLPDKAIDLLDEASARLSLSTPAINQMRETKKLLNEIQAEKQKLETIPDSENAEENQTKYKELADLKYQEIGLSAKEAELEKQCASVCLTVADLAAVIEIWTGVPATEIQQSEYEKISGMKNALQSRIVGQEEAVDAVVRAIKRKRTGVSGRPTPVSFIFAGPTGVGKTELVKVLSSILFTKPESLIRLDMSEYMEKHSVSKIIGAPPGYVGYDEAGQLTEKIRRNPYSIILLDEIEKAHPDVLNILLQVLDEGKLTDAAGRKVNFENCIIVMTTNAGSGSATTISGFSESYSAQASLKTENALSSFLRPEFINRIDEIITFRHLSKDDFIQIAKIMLADTSNALQQKGISLRYSDAVVSYVAEASFSEKYGARNMRRFIEKNIEDPLANEIISCYQTKVDTVKISVKNKKLVVTCQ